MTISSGFFSREKVLRVLATVAFSAVTVVPTAGAVSWWVADWVSGKQEALILKAIESAERSSERQVGTLKTAIEQQGAGLIAAIDNVNTSLGAIQNRLENMQGGYVDIVADTRTSKIEIGRLQMDIDQLKTGFAELSGVIRSGYENPVAWLKSPATWKALSSKFNLTADTPLFFAFQGPDSR